MELTKQERERIKAHIGGMLTGEPVTDAELENLANTAPAALYLITRRELGIIGGASTEDVMQALPDDLLEDLQGKFRDFMERSNPQEPNTWDPEILLLTERLILDGKSADQSTKEEMSRALFDLMSITYTEWKRRCG